MIPPRTNPVDVIAVMAPGNDYDLDANPDLTPFIAIASAIVDRVASCALNIKGIPLNSLELELIERWLAAHFYVVSDQTFSTKSTAGASATFHGKTGDSIDSSRYGKAAMNMDYSGCLTAISKRAFASGFQNAPDYDRSPLTLPPGY